MPYTVNPAGGAAEARWLLMAYDERYVLRDETWMLQQLICRTQFYAAHATGRAMETAG